MNLFIKSILLLTIVLLSHLTTYCQQKNELANKGQSYGIIRDSAHNHVLDLASVAIYKMTDSALVSYQLSNSFGEFRFKEVPLNILLKIVVTYTGYKAMTRSFLISEKEKPFNLGTFNLKRNSIQLNEVVIRYIPPIRMNGDTLEFNAEAFDMDKNAVAEDLLRRLPRLTIWGDGTITVNGKQVKQLLVNGKPFFGGDTRVAIQNIPKNAIDKVQVYKEQQNKRNPMDSITSLNIKLKKDKKDALFGKLSMGFGTDKRYESDGNINMLNKNTQLSIVGATNNVNKVADNANVLLQNSTYKGIGVNIDYQPDFRLAGINKTMSGGLLLQHDFISSSNNFNTSRLISDYYVRDNSNLSSDNLNKITTLGADSIQTQHSNNVNKTGITAHKFKLKYERRKRNLILNASSNLNIFTSNTESENKIKLYDSNGIFQSANNIYDANNVTGKAASIALDIIRDKDYLKMNRLPGNWTINYSFDAGQNYSDRLFRTSFISNTNPTENKKFDRQYQKTKTDIGHHLSADLGDFSTLFFGNRGFMGITFDIKNNLNLTMQKQNNKVRNKDQLDIYQIDPYLTNVSELKITDNKIALDIGKTFMNDLANRYQKLLSLNLLFQEQFYYQNNSSNHASQNFTRSYQKFVPNISVSFINDQYGEFTNNYNLSFSTLSNYPNIEQLRPIVDSANQYYIRLGNENLKEATERKLNFKFDHTSQRMKTKFNYNAEITVGTISNSLSDSSLVDNFGRGTYYTVNAIGNRYLNINAVVNKALIFKENQLQFQLSHSLSISRNPAYVNNAYIISHIKSIDNSINLYYTFSEWWAVNVKESILFYQSAQSGAIDYKFKNSTQSTMLSTSINVNKRLSVGSNVTFNRATSTGSEATDFTIWNANSSYRMLKGNTLELKFTALDLLHQNTTIINTGSNNSITRGTTNVLKQYFMITLAYYPRKFGVKREK